MLSVMPVESSEEIFVVFESREPIDHLQWNLWII